VDAATVLLKRTGGYFYYRLWVSRQWIGSGFLLTCAFLYSASVIEIVWLSLQILQYKAALSGLKTATAPGLGVRLNEGWRRQGFFCADPLIQRHGRECGVQRWVVALCEP
jgi:hypothetical protein